MDTVIILLIISCIVIIMFPIIFAIIVGKKACGKYTVALLGAAGYLIANFGLNTLINIISGHAVENMYDTNELLAALFDGLQQGFVEELMRFLIMLLCMRYSLQKENSLMYAAGHGGVEMIIRGVGIAAGIAVAISNPDDSPYKDMPIFSPFLIPLLFIFVFCLHIGLSYLVFRAVKDKKYPLVLLAVILHAAANFSTAVELPLIPVLGPFVIVTGLLIYTIISYKRDEKMDFF